MLWFVWTKVNVEVVRMSEVVEVSEKAIDLHCKKKKAESAEWWVEWVEKCREIAGAGCFDSGFCSWKYTGAVNCTKIWQTE